ncbi:MAG: 2-oxopent-4-enoate hydratase, partial [Haliea sp.]
MDKQQIARFGDELYQALRELRIVAPLTERAPDISISDAYHISLQMLQQRLERDGERVVGKKIGVTSKPVLDMLCVFQPDLGFLTNAMDYPDGAEIPIAGHLIQPRAEGEIAVRLKKDQQGPGVTEQDV